MVTGQKFNDYVFFWIFTVVGEDRTTNTEQGNPSTHLAAAKECRDSSMASNTRILFPFPSVSPQLFF